MLTLILPVIGAVVESQSGAVVVVCAAAGMDRIKGSAAASSGAMAARETKTRVRQWAKRRTRTLMRVTGVVEGLCALLYARGALARWCLARREALDGP